MRLLALLVLMLVLWVPAAGAWTWPVDGPVVQGFSFDHANPLAAGQHRGVDIGAAAGTPVRAPAAGSISFAGTVAANGRSVTIQTVDGLAVTLTHLGSIAVARGAAVGEGDVVGTVGPSGTVEVSVPYVHLGIRTAADAQGYLDPLAFLPVVGIATPPAAPVADPAAVPAPAAAPGPAPVADPVPAPAPVDPPAAASPIPAADPVPTSAPVDPPAAATPAPAEAPAAPTVATEPPAADAPVAAPTAAVDPAPVAAVDPAPVAEPQPAPLVVVAETAGADVDPTAASTPDSAPEPVASVADTSSPPADPSPAIGSAPAPFAAPLPPVFMSPPLPTVALLPVWELPTLSVRASPTLGPHGSTAATGPAPGHPIVRGTPAAVRPVVAPVAPGHAVAHGASRPAVPLDIGLAAALIAVLGAAASFRWTRMIRSPYPTVPGALLRVAATAEDPRRSRLAVRERPAAHRTRGGLRACRRTSSRATTG